MATRLHVRRSVASPPCPGGKVKPLPVTRSGRGPAVDAAPAPARTAASRNERRYAVASAASVRPSPLVSYVVPALEGGDLGHVDDEVDEHAIGLYPETRCTG